MFLLQRIAVFDCCSVIIQTTSGVKIVKVWSVGEGLALIFKIVVRVVQQKQRTNKLTFKKHSANSALCQHANVGKLKS